MSSPEDRFERAVSELLSDLAPSRPPDRLIPRAEHRVDHARPWPRWLALIKEPPMPISHSLAVGSPTARVMAIMVATLLALVVVSAGVAGGRLLAAEGPIVVDQSGDGTTTTITAAVAMAEDGDTILVRPGTYDESVVLAKDVTIRGDGDRDTIIVELTAETRLGTSCNAPDLPTAFVFEESDATLENLTLRGESARIVILGGAPLLRDLVLDGIGRVYLIDRGSGCVPTGLDINEGSTATIMDSLMSDMDIDIETGSSPSIIGNEFSIGAIWMQGTGVDPIIRENVIDGSVKWGISIGGGARPTVESNTITGATRAIEIVNTGWAIPDTGTDPVIRDNTIIGATQQGISVSSGAGATIEDNVLLGNAVGIRAASDAIIAGNRVEGGGGGIVVLAGSPALVDNVVEGMSGAGISVGRGTSPTLSGNTSCDNGENLRVDDDATPDIDDTNEICEDAPAEPSE